MPFGNGTPKREPPPPERRRQHRRADDLDPESIRGVEFWARLVFLHKGKLITLFSFATGLVGYLVATYGVQERVKNLEAAVTTLNARTERLERNDEMKTFILCAVIREINANLAPPECGPILEKREKK